MTLTPSEKKVQLVAEIGMVVREARKKTGLLQKEAAALCNVGVRFLSDLENGKPTIQLGKTLKVLRGFGLDVFLRKRTLLRSQFEEDSGNVSRSARKKIKIPDFYKRYYNLP